MEELIRSGLDARQAMRYVQVEGGHHHPDTWGRVLPDFLLWAFGQEGSTAELPRPLPVVRLRLDPTLVPIILPATAATAPTLAVPLVLPSAADPVGQLSPPAIVINPHANTLLMPITRPLEGDFLPYAAGYINLVPP